MIVVKGLRETQAAFKQLGDIEGATELKAGLKRAADIVTAEAKLRANGFSFRASDTLRSGSSGRAATVTGGRSSLPWYGWADFGSRTPRKGQPRSMGPWAKSGPGPRGGRFIYPAIAFKSEEVAEAIGAAVQTAAERLGFQVKTHG